MSAIKGIIRQRSANGLRHRRFSITPLQVGQEQRPVLRGARLPHDLPPVHCLLLAGWLPGGPIRQQVRPSERFRVRDMRIQRMHQRRPLLNDPNPRMAVAVNPPLVTLG